MQYDSQELDEWIHKTLSTYYASGNERMVFLLPFNTWIDTYAHGMVAPEHFSITQIEIDYTDNYKTVKEKFYSALRGLGYDSSLNDSRAFQEASSTPKPESFWRKLIGRLVTKAKNLFASIYKKQ